MATSPNTNFVSDKNGSWSYPTSAQLHFGTDFAGSEYIIPVVRFQFFNSIGDDTEDASPIIYIKMGGTFQSGLSNSWAPATNIYGNPASGVNDSSLDAINKLGSSFYEAIQKQLMNTIGAAAGSFASAGQSGRANFEFIQRQVFNNFQQLIYSGPTFRQFSLPFSMKPTSLTEAKAMRDIIQTFRIASSPRVGKPLNNSTATDDLDTKIRDSATNANDETASADKTATITATDLENLIIGSGQSKLFGYPDMCKFQLLLYNHSPSALSTLFESNLCVIENVSTDYGSGNKMTFFDSAISTEYFPTDVTLSLSLREVKLLTTIEITDEYKTKSTMF
jgi:hypothetical protein